MTKGMTIKTIINIGFKLLEGLQEIGDDKDLRIINRGIYQ